MAHKGNPWPVNQQVRLYSSLFDWPFWMPIQFSSAEASWNGSNPPIPIPHATRLCHVENYTYGDRHVEYSYLVPHSTADPLKWELRFDLTADGLALETRVRIFYNGVLQQTSSLLAIGVPSFNVIGVNWASGTIEPGAVVFQDGTAAVIAKRW